MATKRRPPPRTIKLKARERVQLRDLLNGEDASARVRARARILLLSEIGWKRDAIATATGRSTSTVGRVRRDYCESGLIAALSEQPRPGATPRLKGRQQQQVVALACTEPPEGYARWSLRLLTKETLRRAIAPEVSRETVRIALHQHGIKPWREKNVVRPTAGQRVR